MRHLGRIKASPEQLKIISTNQYGAELIRGSAGSGKTTTAILRLTSLANMMRAGKDRVGDESPVRALLLTFNSTLSGYVRALLDAQALDEGHVVERYTFAKWSLSTLGINPTRANNQAKNARVYLHGLAGQKFTDLDPNFVVQEVEYLLGRFEPEALESYISKERTGRGTLPRVNVDLRRKLLDEVVYPYNGYLERNGWIDWNRLAIKMRREVACLQYDIIIVDESQDFSANEIRAINCHLAHNHAVTFVIDTVQRIYARGFTWVEAGVSVSSNRSHRLKENHRNTREIAIFASGILSGITVDTDGVLPNLHAATASGPLPMVILGRYNQQILWAINYIRKNVDLKHETVGFLKPKGRGWFKEVKSQLSKSGIKFVDMQRNRHWPEYDINVAISTFHSAKGLEYDHVIILGFNQENTAFDDEERTDQLQVLRRLLAVAVARARKQVIIGYKPGEESHLTGYFEQGTFERIEL